MLRSFIGILCSLPLAAAVECRAWGGRVESSLRSWLSRVSALVSLATSSDDPHAGPVSSVVGHISLRTENRNRTAGRRPDAGRRDGRDKIISVELTIMTGECLIETCDMYYSSVSIVRFAKNFDTRRAHATLGEAFAEGRFDAPPFLYVCCCNLYLYKLLRGVFIFSSSFLVLAVAVGVMACRRPVPGRTQNGVEPRERLSDSHSDSLIVIRSRYGT